MVPGHPETVKKALRVAAVLSALLTAFPADDAGAAAPQLYRHPGYESPVRGDPDELLLLAGDGLHGGDVVVYRALTDTADIRPHPRSVPLENSAQTGVAQVVSAAGMPRSVTVRLPQQLQRNQSYALWVRTADGDWSAPVLINDARPFWFTPSVVYSSAPLGSLARELKVVGQNLQPGPGATTRIRLTGPETITAAVIGDELTSTPLDQYAARMRLPANLAPGQYRISLSRDGVSWVDVPAQALEVRRDPVAAPQFSPADPQFGGCRPDDGQDDTRCIVSAIAAARRAGGGIVAFGPGTWDLLDSSRALGVVPGAGILIPPGVALQGAGSALTTLNRHASWNARSPMPAFTLSGRNGVSGFRFRDLKVYSATDDAGPILRLGESGVNFAVSEVLITRNVFDRTFIAIGDSGLPIRRLVVSGNEFGAYFEALRLTGDRANAGLPFRIEDSLFTDNVFKPGSRFDPLQHTGDIASELGASSRVDFSGNVADGASTDYLYSDDGPRGWEAAFFWNLNGSAENVLVSRNRATCTGDRTNNGEAIAFDNNGNTFGFDTVTAVTAASPAGITGAAPLRSRQNGREVPRDTYYLGHWVQVVSGPGLGQVRRITAYVVDPHSGIARFTIAPAWDVIPVPGLSRFAVGRQFWQVYAVDNEIDQRQPLCQKSNRTRAAGGSISAWGQMADSAIVGNRQYDTDGIRLQQAYILPEHPCADCGMESFLQYFVDIRDNRIDGEYDWNSDCSDSGISVGLAAAPWNNADPPTVSFGNSISHNLVRHADAAQGGAIAVSASWFPGPSPYRWALSDGLLIQHNTLRDLDGSRALAICRKSHGRIGISLPESAIAWRTVLYGNTCENVAVPMTGQGVETVNVCPSPATRSCDCATEP